MHNFLRNSSLFIFSIGKRRCIDKAAVSLATLHFLNAAIFFSFKTYILQRASWFGLDTGQNMSMETDFEEKFEFGGALSNAKKSAFFAKIGLQAHFKG